VYLWPHVLPPLHPHRNRKYPTVAALEMWNVLNIFFDMYVHFTAKLQPTYFNLYAGTVVLTAVVMKNCILWDKRGGLADKSLAS
jgi:hypothetical protein